MALTFNQSMKAHLLNLIFEIITVAAPPIKACGFEKFHSDDKMENACSPHTDSFLHSFVFNCLFLNMYFELLMKRNGFNVDLYTHIKELPSFFLRDKGAKMLKD